jgi:cytoskeletal protein CcmA (bactofilin family)
MATSQIRKAQYHVAETTIRSDAMFVGILTSSGNVQIDGMIEGEIHSSLHVHVSHEGRVRAQIHAGACTINGSVVGNITATHDVIIESAARVWGQIESPSLQIQPGAIFKGTSHGKDTQDENDMFS